MPEMDFNNDNNAPSKDTPLKEKKKFPDNRITIHKRKSENPYFSSYNSNNTKKNNNKLFPPKKREQPSIVKTLLNYIKIQKNNNKSTMKYGKSKEKLNPRAVERSSLHDVLFRQTEGKQEEKKFKIDLSFQKLIEKNDKDIGNDEMNTVPYTQALRVDKRSLIEIFCSVIKNQIGFLKLLCFNEPYSQFTLELSMYLFEILLDLTMNCYLYSDEVVSEKYNNDGQLSQVTTLTLSIFSNIISAIIAFIISSLVNYTEIIEFIITNVKIIKYYYINVNKSLKIIRIKLCLFFCFEILLLVLMTYYLFIFCTVFHKTQGSIMINYLTGCYVSLATSFGVSAAISIIRKVSIEYQYSRLYYVSKYLYDKF